MNNDDGKFRESREDRPQKYFRGVRPSTFPKFPIIIVHLINISIFTKKYSLLKLAHVSCTGNVECIWSKLSLYAS